MKSKTTFFFTAGLTATMLLAPELAFANGGEGTLDAVQKVLRGNVGTVLGLGLAVYGLWKWMMDQESWGIVMIIGGVAITAFPGFFASAQNTMYSLFEGAGASQDSQTGITVTNSSPHP